MRSLKERLFRIHRRSRSWLASHFPSVWPLVGSRNNTFKEGVDLGDEKKKRRESKGHESSSPKPPPEIPLSWWKQLLLRNHSDLAFIITVVTGHDPFGGSGHIESTHRSRQVYDMLEVRVRDDLDGLRGVIKPPNPRAFDQRPTVHIPRDQLANVIRFVGQHLPLQDFVQELLDTEGGSEQPTTPSPISDLAGPAGGLEIGHSLPELGADRASRLSAPVIAEPVEPVERESDLMGAETAPANTEPLDGETVSTDASYCRAITEKDSRTLTQEGYETEAERGDAWGLLVDMVQPIKQGRYRVMGASVPKDRTLDPKHALLWLKSALSPQPMGIKQLGFLNVGEPTKTVERLRREWRHAAGGDIFRTHVEQGKGTAYSWSAECSWCFLVPERLLND